VLGRAHEIGQITPGHCADIALFRTDTLAMAGAAVHDPVGALLMCAAPQADHVLVNGRMVVRDGHITTIDLPALVAQHNRHARTLAQA
jgi:8-oxoguanine deaminase